MLSESYPTIRNILRFLALPYCYLKLVNWNECSASKYQVFKDLLYIFFRLRYFPDNYSPCRLWEKERTLWHFYYGSSYHPYQRAKLRKEVQPFEYISLFDDKEVCELVSRGIGVKLPAYYGVVTPEMDYRTKIIDTLNANPGKKVIIKPVKGSAGKGIALAYKNKNEIRVKIGKTEVDVSQFRLMERSILQEVVLQDKIVAKFSSSSVNTIRVVTLLNKAGQAILVSASMRFGVGKAYVDNWSAGGVAVGVDYKNGSLKNIAYNKKGNQYTVHPVSNVIFNGFQIPKWSEVVEMALDVQEKCSFFRMLGLDIAVTCDGPVLIEINPNPDLIFQEQTGGPLLEDRQILMEFDRYDLLINKYQRNLLRK